LYILIHDLNILDIYLIKKKKRKRKRKRRTVRKERRKEKGERRKEKGERRKEKGERRKEKGERRKEKGERSWPLTQPGAVHCLWPTPTALHRPRLCPRHATSR